MTAFTPRPEAQAYSWEKLLKPIRKATGELILWLEGAYHSSASLEDEEQLATSLLVSGERGSGKTTVLLSAASAFRQVQDFMPREASARAKDPAEEAEDKEREVRRALAVLHRHVIWLDLLDVEPLPRDVNLLATLLVRVRAVLDQAYGSPAHEGWAAPSLLEERGANPWGQIDQLIRDAAFLWERTSERDLRLRSEQQIKSAELYVSFRRRFREAMESVVQALSQREFGRERSQNLILVMPIDNVDRSVDHIRHILNLSGLVASRRLWFVLAAGGAELQLFLERIFQDELSAYGSGPLGAENLEETLAIARRQAAAALRKKAPPIQRIHIERVLPDEAWRFCPPGGGSEQSPRGLGELLSRIPLPLFRTEQGGAKGEHVGTLADLFDIHTRLSDDVRRVLWSLWPRTPRKAQVDAGGETDGRAIFSNAGRLTLTLPARPLQDLWRAALKEAEVEPRPGDAEAAIRVVRAMLLNAINESELPAWASDVLQGRIIQRNTEGATILNLTGNPVSRQSMGTERERLETFPSELADAADDPRASGPEARLKTEVLLREFTEIRLRLHSPEQPDRQVELPANVTGWLILLHDLLTMNLKPGLLNASATPLQAHLGLAFTVHQAVLRPPEVVELSLSWRTPVWDTFLDFSIFTVQWLSLLLKLEGLVKDKPDRRHSPAFVRSCAELFHAAWIDNVCSIAGERHGHLRFAEAFGLLEKAVDAPGGELGGAGLHAYQVGVRERLAELFEKAQEQHASGPLEPGARKAWRSRLEATLHWVEEFLPQFLLPEFAPDVSLLHVFLREGTQESPSGAQADRHARLLHRWGRLERLLAQRRYLTVMEALEHSRAYRGMCQRAADGAGDPVHPCRDWLLQATDRWFQGHGAERFKPLVGAGEMPT